MRRPISTSVFSSAVLPGALLLLGGCGEPHGEASPRMQSGLDGVTLIARGHQELAARDDGALLPRWLGPKRRFGFCLETPLELDTSQWTARFGFGTTAMTEREFHPPIGRAGTTLCFAEPPPADLPTGPVEVCATLHDGFDGRRHRLPCFWALYDADPSAYLALVQESFAVIGQRAERPGEETLAALDRMARRAEAAGYPKLAVNLRLVAVEENLRIGTSAALGEAERLLDSLPGWLDRPVAAITATKVAYERALVAMARGRLHHAWQLLGEGERLARRCAALEHLSIAKTQAEILHRVGARGEPIRRLSAALADCAHWPCDPRIVPSAHGDLAWLVMLDPDATAESLARAEESLRIALESEAFAHEPQERANQLINRALLASRQRRSPESPLAEARAVLQQLEPTPRVLLLSDWAEVVEGLDALASSAPERALERCARAAASAFPGLSSRALSCLGQAHRRLGAPERAEQAFERALLRHELATPERLGQDLPLAPGWRADDYYRTARLALERGRPERAWQVLEALDRRAAGGPESCGEEREPPAWRERRREELLARLAQTDPPFAPERERQLQPVRRSLLQALEELHRTLDGGCRAAPTKPGPAADLRAFALPDEVLLLGRRPGGEVELLRRADASRLELRTVIERLLEAQQDAALGEGLGDAEWRALARPLAEVLVPPEAFRGEVTRFALHGVLQKAPLAALPLPDSSEARWLGERTTPALRPAWVEGAPLGTDDPVRREALFVVDPRRDLPSGAEARDVYRELFPRARILFGERATRAGVREAFAAAPFLHVDAHGLYDAAFPQLSGLLMSDGALRLADFVKLPLPRRFVNLSGCHTGSSEASGDSGRFGLAGALASRGVPWVVASRTEIPDRLGRDFNVAFYREIADGRRVPAAFRTALADLRRDHPAAAWSSFFLLAGGEELRSRGQNPVGGD